MNRKSNPHNCGIVNGSCDRGRGAAYAHPSVPKCQVNVPAARYFGVPVSVVLSREIVNMVVNPWLAGIVLTPYNLGPNSAIAYLRESADPVGGLTYTIDGVPVSDFTFPQFCQNVPSGGVPIDFLHRATSPLQPLGVGFSKARWITPSGGINSLRRRVLPRLLAFACNCGLMRYNQATR
jgi:hypothetical protein